MSTAGKRVFEVDPAEVEETRKKKMNQPQSFDIPVSVEETPTPYFPQQSVAFPSVSSSIFPHLASDLYLGAGGGIDQPTVTVPLVYEVEDNRFLEFSFPNESIPIPPTELDLDAEELESSLFLKVASDTFLLSTPPSEIKLEDPRDRNQYVLRNVAHFQNLEISSMSSALRDLIILLNKRRLRWEIKRT